MRNTLILAFATLIIVSCQTNSENSADVLLKIDKEFSDYSLANGTKEAFLKYAADSAVMLSNHSLPIKGKSAINEVFPSSDSINSTLTWEPAYAQISESKDIGYTYGFYKSTKRKGVEIIQNEGCYVTIWQKNKSGIWKWVMDCGTIGLE
jgi:ketosteroid isomerase-like protein